MNENSPCNHATPHSAINALNNEPSIGNKPAAAAASVAAAINNDLFSASLCYSCIFLILLIRFFFKREPEPSRTVGRLPYTMTDCCAAACVCSRLCADGVCVRRSCYVLRVVLKLRILQATITFNGYHISIYHVCVLYFCFCCTVGVQQ